MSSNDTPSGEKEQAVKAFQRGNSTKMKKSATIKRPSMKTFENKAKKKIEFNGNEFVEHSRTTNEDFVLPLKNHVANYNPDILTKDWNDNKTASCRNCDRFWWIDGASRRI